MVQNFNPRPSVRGDAPIAESIIVSELFQSTPLCEGRHTMVDLPLPPPTNFNPRPSVRGDIREQLPALILARFQSTPLCEGRREGRIARAHAQYFNPRPSVRGDVTPYDTEHKVIYFNPRPSVRGDQWQSSGRSYPRHFNPRPSVRGDIRWFRSAHAKTFQSTPLCEGRRARPARNRQNWNFNPRPSVRGDRVGLAGDAGLRISIHAPP